MLLIEPAAQLLGGCAAKLLKFGRSRQLLQSVFGLQRAAAIWELPGAQDPDGSPRTGIGRALAGLMGLEALLDIHGDAAVVAATLAFQQVQPIGLLKVPRGGWRVI